MSSSSFASLREHYDRRTFLKLTGLGAAAFAAAASSTHGSTPVAMANDPPPFDVNTGIAPLELIIPNVVPQIFATTSPFAMDATIVLRITTLITNAWFDAIAPYHPSAVGVYSSIDRQPAVESTLTNKNIATLYASFRVLLSVLPESTSEWRGILLSAGLNPDDDQQNSSGPIGIGNLAGAAVVAARENDGMNQLGNEGGGLYNRRRYADYTGYEPENTAYHLKKAGRWQPDILTAGAGIFQVQQHVTPQMALTDSYTGLNPSDYPTPRPKASQTGAPAYKQQVDEVLAASAAMTDHQKMTAELYDNKLLSLGFVALHVFGSRGLSFDQFVQYDFLVNLAAFDTAIVIWNEKLRWDAVRPFSAVTNVYGDSPITAWGGPGQGTVNDLPASQWRPYLQTADHSEYPSGSAAFCAAHAQASRRFLGDDILNWTVPYAQGSSRIEPGHTPSSDIALHWNTWTEFETDCGLSRFWGGVHFLPSIDVARPIGHAVGDLAYDFVNAHINGNA